MARFGKCADLRLILGESASLGYIKLSIGTCRAHRIATIEAQIFSGRSQIFARYSSPAEPLESRDTSFQYGRLVRVPQSTGSKSADMIQERWTAQSSTSRGIGMIPQEVGRWETS